MRAEDLTEFNELLDATYELLAKTPQQKIIGGTARALFFKVLARFPLPTVRAAMEAHCASSTFPPTPNDIIARIEGSAVNDGRPGAEEAWAIALTAQDEAATIVWTAEIAQALQVCQPVLSTSGPISARKTFIETYERLVKAARADQKPVKWTHHLGWDKSQHAPVLERAVKAGLLPAPAVAGLLPPPETDALTSDPAAREQLAKIRKLIAEGEEEKQKRLLAAEDARMEAERATSESIGTTVEQYAQAKGIPTDLDPEHAALLPRHDEATLQRKPGRRAP
jgi:hypothetical protein